MRIAYRQWQIFGGSRNESATVVTHHDRELTSAAPCRAHRTSCRPEANRCRLRGVGSEQFSIDRMGSWHGRPKIRRFASGHTPARADNLRRTRSRSSARDRGTVCLIRPDDCLLRQKSIDAAPSVVQGTRRDAIPIDIKRLSEGACVRFNQTIASLAAAARPRSQLMLANSSTANTISMVATARIDGSMESLMPLHICRGTVF